MSIGNHNGTIGSSRLIAYGTRSGYDITLRTGPSQVVVAWSPTRAEADRMVALGVVAVDPRFVVTRHVSLGEPVDYQVCDELTGHTLYFGPSCRDALARAQQARRDLEGEAPRPIVAEAVCGDCDHCGNCDNHGLPLTDLDLDADTDASFAAALEAELGNRLLAGPEHDPDHPGPIWRQLRAEADDLEDGGYLGPLARRYLAEGMRELARREEGRNASGLGETIRAIRAAAKRGVR